MATLRDLLAACDLAIRGQLNADEDVLAVGRCEDITDGRRLEGGATWTYLMVTNRRLRWVPRSQLRFEAALELDGVTAVAEETNGHRYAITLVHAPLIRAHHVPAHRLLMFRWGNAERMDEFRRTRLAFSRVDTSGALALRRELVRRNLL